MDCFFQRALTHAHRISHTVFTSLLALVQLATQMPHVLTAVCCVLQKTLVWSSLVIYFILPQYLHTLVLIIVQVLCPSKIVKVMDAVGVH